ncbi:MAG: TIGR02147 family protein [Bdellovibrionales bacterium]|nr:TIGR02147 family protein [Bdellovibrionales bacterium]
MNKDVFDFTDYKAYLLHFIKHSPKNGRGVRRAMAEAIRCPVSHISQVISGSSQFTAEQAEEMNDYLGHTEDKAQYFMLLVHYARAGSHKLQERLKKQITAAQEKRLFLKDRLGVKAEILPADQATFYSSWLYGAIHVMTTIPEFQTREKISDHLNISLKKTTEILEFLVQIGLVVENKNEYRIGTSRIHLGSDSPLISKFHTNWRMKAIQSLDREDTQRDLHYSSAITLSEDDYLKIKSQLVKSINDAKNIIRDSKEETLAAFSVDFFKI